MTSTTSLDLSRQDCHWPYIGVCIGEAGPTVDESKISCLYMSSKDDCRFTTRPGRGCHLKRALTTLPCLREGEWPDQFPAGTYPAKVDIWRKSF